MAEIDQALLDEMNVIAEATGKAELELLQKRVELLSPIWEKRRALIAKIPKFWSTVVQKHDALAQMVEEVDLPILEHLTDVWVKHDSKDARNYEIIFTFSENPHFKNKTLVKKVTMKDDEAVTEEFKIDWKEGKDVTVKDHKRKKSDSDNISDSFFSWFRDEDTSLADLFVHEIYPEALSVYAEDDEDFEDDESVDLDDDEEDEDDEEEEEEKHTKKKSKK
ncbi:hypothetical protein BGZ98_005204 [Dissophora globulifera]|nr:hypothetical protein BGZ98_005204 [Dissophora globulifera]